MTSAFSIDPASVGAHLRLVKPEPEIKWVMNQAGQWVRQPTIRTRDAKAGWIEIPAEVPHEQR